MLETILRPLWRAFSPEQLRTAVKHARRGGIAIVKERPTWRLLGDAGPPGEELPLLVDWAIRAVESAKWAELVEGPAKGLVEAKVTREWRTRVNEWIERDLAFEGSVAPTSLDCMLCGACCFDNKVVLDEQDIARWQIAKRADLLKRTSRREGLRLLPLARTENRPCIYLEDLKCTIYEHRPNMCRDFPAGTEQCFTSREDLYGTPFPLGR